MVVTFGGSRTVRAFLDNIFVVVVVVQSRQMGL